ncbi:MAG: hypothetical protein IKN91_05990 [Paludibacteraceae bacterium]|nr:hypothetical protein [Paludibacteraceae bacterium]
MIVFSVLLIAACLFAGYFLLVGIAYLVAFIVAAVQVRTGRISREQLAENAVQHKRQKL